MTTQPEKIRSRCRLPMIGAGLALLAMLIGAALIGGGGEDNAIAGQPLALVQRGPLTISVSEAGTIQARDQVILKSQVEGTTTIIFLVPEGTRVTKGDLLVELDASNFETQLEDQEIRVQNAEAAFIRARENMEVVRSQGLSDIARAELNYRFAREDLNQYEEGEYPKQLKEAESKITLANEERERAAEKLKWSQRLFDEKYISQTELEADRLTHNRAQLDYELAVASRDLLVKFTYHRRLDELKSEIEQTGMELERVRRRAKADLIQVEADLKAKESEFRQQKVRRDKIKRQIANTKLYAPIDGMVVYATSAQGNWRGNAEPLDEGQTVRERQELIYLPTADSMNAEIKVHESSLEKVQLGMPVRVTVDALPGRTFSGKVTKIAPLPDAQSMWLNPDLKVFTTLIQLDQGDGLRTGMSCRAEILIDRYDNAVYVPMQSVVRVKGQHTAYVVRGNRVEPRAVTIGMDNNRMVKIDAGLEPGERVLLTPPLTASSEAPILEVDEAPESIDQGDGNVEASTASAEPIALPEPAGTVSRDADEAGRADEADEAGRTAAPDSTEPASEQQDRPRRALTPEQREAMRRRFENMSPEERQRLRALRQRDRQTTDTQ